MHNEITYILYIKYIYIKAKKVDNVIKEDRDPQSESRSSYFSQFSL